MNKTNNSAIMKALSYSSPEVLIQEFRLEGLLCSSPEGSSADDFILGDELGKDDYEQIF